LFDEFLLYQPNSPSVVPTVIKLIYNKINNLSKQKSKYLFERIKKNRVIGKNLKYIMSGGAPLDSTYIRKFKKIWYKNSTVLWYD